MQSINALIRIEILNDAVNKILIYLNCCFLILSSFIRLHHKKRAKSSYSDLQSIRRLNCVIYNNPYNFY